MKKFNSGLLLVGAASASLALAGSAHASPTDGIFSSANVTGGALGTVPAVVNPDAAANTASTKAASTTAKSAVTGALSTANKADVAAYNSAITAQTAKGTALTAANTALTKANTAATNATLYKTNIQSALTAAQTAASNAAADQLTAQGAYDAALLAASGNTSAAAVVSAQAVLDAAKLKSSAAAAAVTPLSSALTTAISAETTAITAQNAANLAQVQASNDKNLADTAVGNALSTLNTGLSNNASLQLAVAAYNTAQGLSGGAVVVGTSYTTNLAAIINPAPAPAAGTDWYARNTGIMAAAKASTYAYVANAAGALDGTNTGAHFETEVLGALSDHETRIVANAQAIVDETVARKAADVVLDGRITQEVSDRKAADLVETNARIAADTAETNARVAADNQLRDQIASSTATAIALGGNTILPGTKFSLSGNVGFYKGATAVALNAAVQISAKAYATAAFGGGLNKGGQAGGRVGFVLGF